MLTPDKAAELVDHSLPEEEQIRSAGVLIASSAAYDAYLNSRPQLEQIIARANGGGEIPSHDELNDPAKQTEAGQSPPSPVGEGKGIALGTVVEETEAEQELRAARERVAQLEAAKG